VTSKTILGITGTDVRMRGAYTTPDAIAQFLVSWAIRSPNDLAIDPSCGDGIFLEAIANRLLFLGGETATIKQITGVEIDRAAAEQASNRISDHFRVTPNIVRKGFFAALSSFRGESFEAAVGNPPFVRYRHFFEEERELALKFLRGQGFRASKLTNAWVPFLIAAVYLLKPKGRLAMVVPAELFQVSYAESIREYLMNCFGFIFVVTFSRLVFPDAEQEIVLLMGIKGEGKGLRLLEIKDESELARLPQSMVPQVPVEDSKEKWTQYFLSDSQRSALRKALRNDKVKRLGQFCSVDVGVVTGANDFFVLQPEDAMRLKARDHLLPIVTHTKHLRGLNFSKKDWLENASNHQPSYLLSIKPSLGMSRNLQQYIVQGEQDGWRSHYKCKNRDPWFLVHSVWTPDAFLFRQIGAFPRLVLNNASATCTDTLHRVRFNRKNMKRSIIACFHNSLTLASAEIFGRSYGGGVLELMPTEAEKLPVPELQANDLFSEADKLVRDGKPTEMIEFVDKEVLQEGLGFRKEDIALIRSSWQDLSRRRKSRRWSKV
jgi:adenine-specific DNA-methyltransferase